MVREILKIYTDDGLGSENPTFKDIEIAEYQYKGSRMGFPELTATLMWGTCLDKEWSGREYATLYGERFYIRHTPSSSKSNADARYKHDISFTSEFAEILGNVYFIDAVPDGGAEYNKPCTNSSRFKFYGTIHEVVGRLNAAFQKAGLVGYSAEVDPSGAESVYDPNKSYSFEWEDKYLWDAITEIYSITEIPFERRGRKIIFGAQPAVLERVFEYGRDNELLSVGKNNANAKVVNRVTMRGSSENIPYYYPNETEYGHISIAAKAGNKALAASMVSIENMSQLLSRLSAGEFAVLCKHGAESPDDGKASLTEIYFAFGKEGLYEKYNADDRVKYESDDPALADFTWRIKVKFNVSKGGDIVCSAINGDTWFANEAPPTYGGSNLLSALSLVSLRPASDETKNYASQAEKTETGLNLGKLQSGDYFMELQTTLPNKDGGKGGHVTVFCRLTAVSFAKDVSAAPAGYYWLASDKRYDAAGAFGVKISAELTDAMVGDGFGWEASGRMDFQDHLVPPKYRNTLGAERFYNALDNTYTDPDTNGYYEFPNPFMEGAPCEHIYVNEDIKPTIEGVKNASDQLLGSIAAVAYDAGDSDALKPDAEEGDKNDALKYEHSFFYVKLYAFTGQYGFDLFKSASQSGAMTIQMTSGACEGCKFKIQAAKFTDGTGLEYYRNPVIVADGVPVGVVSEEGLKESDLDPAQQDTRENSIWVCVQKDAETFGAIMPNKSNGYQPAAGDKFNIVNIDLPQEYIDAAEKRLEQEGLRFMADNNEEKFTFDIQASRIFFAEHPEVLAELDEYSKIKVRYDGKVYEQYVNQLTIDCKDGEALPNIGVSLAEDLAVGPSFAERVAERASSLIANPYTMGGALGTAAGGGLSAALADQRYLSKLKNDRAKGKIASDVGFEVGRYVSGGSGGIFYQDAETGRTFLETDVLKVRMKAIFEELEVAKVSTIGGEFIITPGGGIDVSFVEEVTEGTGADKAVVAYRCYFKEREDGDKAECRFAVGDQAICKEFGKDNAALRFYWRKVTKVANGGSYVELSAEDCAAGSDAPRIGDTLVQLGSRNNPQRQSAIVLSTVDAFAPCVTLYNGIGLGTKKAEWYSLVGKEVVQYGVDKTNNPPEPFFHCYGSFYYGKRNGDSFLKYDAAEDKLLFSGTMVNVSIGDKPIDDYIAGLIPELTQEDIDPFLSAVVGDISNIQNQIDGVIETWFGEGAPSLDRTEYPMNQWGDTSDDAHLGDLYYDNATGMAYRFSKDADGNYFWNVITDDAITKALEAAKNAQDTADGKRKVFVVRPKSVPNQPDNMAYDVGDIWVNATYPEGAAAETRDPAQGRYFNDILRCVTAKSAEEPFSIADWKLASNYTDDTTANKALEEIAGYEYIKEALADGATVTQQGLILTSLIRLGMWDKSNPENPIQSSVWAGINGIRLSDKSIASWWGGDMTDRYYDSGGNARPTPLAPQLDANGYPNFAAALVRMDGTGYLSKGNILWNADGSGSVAGGNLKWDKNGALQFSNGIKIGVGGANETTLGALAESIMSVSALFGKFTANFVPMALGENGEPQETSWGEIGEGKPLYAVKSRKGFYSEEFISARGLNPDGSAGGGATQLRMLSDVFIGNNLADGQALVYSETANNGNGGWVNQAISQGLDTAQLAQYLADYNYAKKSDIPSLTGYATQEWVEGKGYITSSALTGYAKTTDIQSWVEGKGYLTDYTIHALTLQEGAFTAKTYNPKSAAQTVNIPTTTSHITEGTRLYFTDARAQNALAGHTTDTTIHITAAERTAWNAKLDKSIYDTFKSGYDTWKATVDAFVTKFNSMFAKESDGSGGYRIKALFGLYTEQFLSAKGLNSQAGGSGAFNLMRTWDEAESGNANTQYALGSNLGWELRQRIDNLPTTSVNPYALTIQKNGATVKAYDGSSAVTANITVPTNVSELTNTTLLKIDGSNGTLAGISALIRKLSLGDSDVTDNTMFVTSHVSGESGSTNYYKRSATYLWNYIKGKTDALYQPLEDGKGLSSNDFTDTLLDKLNGIEAGANKYVHPTNGANTTITAASGKVLSAITVNSLGHVTSVSSKTLVAADIPTLAISKISGLQTALDAKLDVSVFTELFEKVNIGTASAPVYAIKAKLGLYTDDFLSARGLNPNASGGAVGNRLDSWTDYGTDKEGWILSAKLGFDLKTRIDSLPTTSVNPYSLTIQKNGTTLGAYDGSVAKTINISDVASAATLSSHTGNTTIHIAAEERTKWNKVAADFAAIVGEDADNIINKWEEVVAFLDTYTEADTLAGLLSNKADKTTQIIAGTGLTGGGTLASDRTLSLATSGVTAGTYTKLTVDAYGRATAGASLAASDIPSLDWSKITTGKPTTLAGYGITDAYTKTEADNRYVNVSGDTMTGILTMTAATDAVIKMQLKQNGGQASGVHYFDANGRVAGIGYFASMADGVADPHWAFIGWGASPWEAANCLAVAKNRFAYKNNAVLHEGNYASILDARYVNVDGDTMTGLLTLNAGAKVASGQKLTIGDCEITWDATNDGLKFSKGIYSEGFVSAKGLNSAAGGGTAWGLMKNWDEYTTSIKDTDALSAGLGKGLLDRIVSLESKNYLNDLGISVTGSGNAVTSVSQSTDKKTLTFTKGSAFLTSSSLANYYTKTEADGKFALASALGNYLPLTGGTLTGRLFVASGSDAKLILNNTDTETYYQYISFRDNGTEYGTLGTLGTTALRWNSNIIWHSGNDGSGSGLDADLLDGKHNGEVTAKELTVISPKIVGVTVAEAKANMLNAVKGNAFGNVAKIGASLIENWENDSFTTTASSVYSVINVTPQYDGDVYGQYLLFHLGSMDPKLIGRNNGAWTALRTFAFTDSNVASATKLQTARNLWGQPFDGTGNVNGHLSIGTIIGQVNDGRAELSLVSVGDSPCDLMLGRSGTKKWSITSRNSSDSDRFSIYNYTNNVWCLNILENGNVGIGTTSPAYKLHVNGKIKANNEIISTSGNAFRMVQGNYGAFFRNDGNNTYLLLTDSGDQFGNWNSLRPFGVNNSSGRVTMGNGLTVNEITIGSCTIKYENGGLHFSSGIYSDSFVSAKGLNANAGSGAAFGLLKTWQAPTSDNENDAFSAQAVWDKINGLPTTSVNPYALTIQKNGTTVATYSGASAVTANIAIAKADVEAVLTGNITSHTHSQYLTSHQSLASYMGFKRETVDPNTITTISVREVNNATNAPSTNSWHQYMTWGTGDSNYAFQFANKYSAAGNLFFRQKITGTWGNWKTIIDSSNIGSYAITEHQSLANYYTKAETASNFIKYTVGGELKWEWGSNLTHVVGFEGASSIKLRVYNGASIRSFASVYSKSEIDTKLTDGSVTKVGTADVGSATLPMYLNGGTPTACTAASVFSALAMSGNSLSVTVAGQNRTLTVGYASKAGQLNASKTLWGQSFNGSANVSGDMTDVGNVESSGNVNTLAGKVFGLSSSDESYATKGQAYYQPMHSQGWSQIKMPSGGLRVKNNAATPADVMSLDNEGTLAIRKLIIGSGSNSVTLSFDTANSALKVDKGMYSTSFVSAKGASSAAGSDIALGTNKIIGWQDAAILESTSQGATKLVGPTSLDISASYGGITVKAQSFTAMSIAPAQTVTCNGTWTISSLKYGSISQTSDERMKSKAADLELPLDDIAGAPCLRFRWKNDPSGRLMAGTYAQYWQKKLPEAVDSSDPATLGMDYACAAMVAVISLSREVKRLKERLQGLSERIAALEAGSAAKNP